MELTTIILALFILGYLAIAFEHNIKIEGRKNLIRRCIINIIGNGLSYGDKISIKTKKSVNSGIITIEDNGPGIPKEEYSNVFKPFYKIDKGRSDSKSSVGLGLSIASDIIRS